jgi:hypothetical protein
MKVVQLKKNFRLVWNAQNEIIVNGEFDSKNTTGTLASRSFEADTQAEIDAKIQELNLTEVSDV